jgi:hypothetical protein
MIYVLTKIKKGFRVKRLREGRLPTAEDQAICLFAGLLDDPDRKHSLWSNVLSLL